MTKRFPKYKLPHQIFSFYHYYHDLYLSFLNLAVHNILEERMARENLDELLSIKIKRRAIERLKLIGVFGQTYSEVIEMLLDEHDKRAKRRGAK